MYKVYKDLQTLKQFVDVFNNPYFIFLMGPFHNKKVSSNDSKLLYAELLLVVKALFVFYRELQYLLYLPEQLFLETQNCALNVLNGFGGVVQRQRTVPAENQGFCSYSLNQETISLTNFCILLSFLCLPHNSTSSVFFFIFTVSFLQRTVLADLVGSR